MIEIKNLSKRFNNTTVFENISYSFDGKILGIFGDKSSGKTVLLSIICGIIPPSEGEVLVSGKDLSKDIVLANKTVGYLLEKSPMPKEMTPLEFLIFIGKAQGIPSKKLLKQANTALGITSLTDLKNTYIAHLTTGQRMLLGVAQTLLGNPEVIVLDSPFTKLNKNEKAVMRNVILTLGEFKTVIISDRSEETISDLCSEIIHLSKAFEEARVEDSAPVESEEVEAKEEK